MAVRKKKTSTKTAQAGVLEDKAGGEETRVQHVVEVVGDDTKDELLGEIKQDTQEINRAVEMLEEETAGAEEPSQEAAKEEAPEEEGKRKEAVQELFAPKTNPIAPDIASYKPTKRMPLWLWLVIVLGVAILVGGVAVSLFGDTESFSLVTGTTPTPTVAPSATPTPQALDRAALTIEVLNGGGVVGAAGKMKTQLEELGYTVLDVGNADEYVYEETEIQVKKSKEAYMSLLESDLKDQYVLGTVSATLAEDSSYDARVIVGKE